MPFYEIAVVPEDRSKSRGLSMREPGEPIEIKPAGRGWGKRELEIFDFVKMELTEAEAKAMCCNLTEKQPVLVAQTDKDGKYLEPIVETQDVEVLERRYRIDLAAARPVKETTSKTCIIDMATQIIAEKDAK